MLIQGQETININGKEYWSMQQFAVLTGRRESAIYHLIKKGNRLRRLKVLKIEKKKFVEADELFNFPFIIIGRPNSENQIFIQKFKLENKNLVSKEELYKLDPRNVTIES